MTTLRLKTACAAAAVSALAATGAHATITTGWVNNATGSGRPVLQEFNIATGEVIKEIKAPRGSNGRGIVQVGNTLYYTGSGTNSVYAYDFATDTDLGTVFSVAGATALATMAYDGTDFYLGDYSGTNHVYKYSVTGTLLSTISLSLCEEFCDGLEYVNGTLISNRGDRDPNYDIYALDGTLLQAGFIVAAQPSTGIAFDGTNYYTDNVFGDSFSTWDSTGAFIKTTFYVGGKHVGEDLSVNYAERGDTGGGGGGGNTGGGVPEPATWALLIAGFGLAGMALRRRRAAYA